MLLHWQQGEKHSPISPSLCDYPPLANNSLFYQLFISRPCTHTRTLTQSHASTQYPCRRPWNGGSWKWRCLCFYCILFFTSAHYENNISLKWRTHVNTWVKGQKTSFHFPHPERSVGTKQLASFCMWLLLPDCLVCLHEWVQMFIAPLHVHRG